MERTKDFFKWIEEHAKENPSALRLKYSGKQGAFDYADAINQIECRRKFATKFADTLDAFPDFYFPTILSGEQATSDKLATYHASYMPEGMAAVDLTAGLGIDSMHLASRAESVISIERYPEYVEALAYNSNGLHINNLKTIHGDCRDILHRLVEEGCHFGLAFIDPARRSSDGGRVYALSDCEPDVIDMIPDISRISDLLLMKVSPMLDISHTVSSLPVAPVSVAAVGSKTECKELLVLIDFKRPVAQTLIEAVTILPDEVKTFSFTQSAEVSMPLPSGFMPTKGAYIYEPWPAVMKTGVFRILAKEYGLDTITPNTRLFHSPDLVRDFPGTVYRIEDIFPFASGILKRFKRNYPMVNVAVRNFGMSAETLRAKLGVIDKGPLRLYGVTDDKDTRYLILTSPV